MLSGLSKDDKVNSCHLPGGLVQLAVTRESEEGKKLDVIIIDSKCEVKSQKLHQLSSEKNLNILQNNRGEILQVHLHTESIIDQVFCYEEKAPELPLLKIGAT